MNHHAFSGERSASIRCADLDPADQTKRRKLQPVNGSSAIRNTTGRDQEPSVIFKILIRIPGLTGNLADEFAATIPQIKISAVPVAADDEVGRDSDAPNVIRHFELRFELQRALVSTLNDRGTVRFVLGYWNPKRSLVGSKSARVILLALLDFDLLPHSASFEIECEEEALLSRSVNGSDPKRRAVSFNSLDVKGLAFERSNGLRVFRFKTGQRLPEGSRCQ